MSETPEVAGPRLSRVDVEALAARLTMEAADLRATIAGLRADLQTAEEKSALDLAAENAARRRSFRRAWITIALDIALSLAGVSLYLGQQDTNHRIQETNQQIQKSLSQNYVTAQQQVQTRIALLCPLYGTLYALAEAQPPGAPLTDAQEKARAGAVETLKAGYAKAGCQPPLP